jgi:hypothetical protein
MSIGATEDTEIGHGEHQEHEGYGHRGEMKDSGAENLERVL